MVLRTIDCFMDGWTATSEDSETGSSSSQTGGCFALGVLLLDLSFLILRFLPPGFDTILLRF